MRALTLWRPWSDAIVHGSKRVENRPLPPPRKLIGTVVAIHAGKRYEAGEWSMPDGYAPPSEEQSPKGIVGVARVVGALDLREGRGPTGRRIWKPSATLWTMTDAHRRRLERLDDDPWWAGPVGILLDEVTPIPPVFCRGHQGWWTVPETTAARVRLRVRAVQFGELDPRPVRDRVRQREAELVKLPEARVLERIHRAGIRRHVTLQELAVAEIAKETSVEETQLAKAEGRLR